MCLLRAEVSTSRAVRTVADVTDTTFLLKQQALSQPSCSSSTFLPSSAPVAVFQLLTTQPSNHDRDPPLREFISSSRLSRYQVPDSHALHCAPRDQTLHIREGLRLVSEQPERHQ